jgi:hypothetical protein
MSDDSQHASLTDLVDHLLPARTLFYLSLDPSSKADHVWRAPYGRVSTVNLDPGDSQKGRGAERAGVGAYQVVGENPEIVSVSTIPVGQLWRGPFAVGCCGMDVRDTFVPVPLDVECSFHEVKHPFLPGRRVRP